MAQTAFSIATDGTRTTFNTTSGGTELSGTTPFVVATSAAKLNGISYDFSVPGLYRFKNDSQNYYQYKFVVELGSALDVYNLMHAFSNHHVIGTANNTTGYGLTNHMRYSPVSAQCGYISSLPVWIMPQMGWNSSNVRTINFMTLGAQNGMDDGHVVCETKHGTEWRMWDLTNGVYYTMGGHHLSGAELVAQIANGGTFPTKNYLGKPKEVDSVCAMYGNTYINLKEYINEYVNGSDSMFEAWNRRIAQSIV
jgi:hypothetical protein